MTATPVISLKAGDPKKTTANLLPCRIHHDGLVDPIDSYWKPMINNDDKTRQAYFHGRKLHGKTIPLPDRYRGVVMERSADELQKEVQPITDDVDMDADDHVAALEMVGSMQATGEFDEMVVWSHESTGTDAADPYVRSVEEWLQVSEKIHNFKDETSDKPK